MLPSALLVLLAGVVPVMGARGVAAQAAGAQAGLAQTGAPPSPVGAPDARRGEWLAGRCEGCHGPFGREPVLEGMPAAEMLNLLARFRARERPNATMQGIAANLSDQDMADLAAYYSRAGQATTPPTTPAPAVAPVPAPPVPAPVAPPPAPAGATLKAAQRYAQGDPGRNLMACAVCHGPQGQGSAALRLPALRGLSQSEALRELQGFRAPGSSGNVRHQTMRVALLPLTDQELLELAAFIATLP